MIKNEQGSNYSVNASQLHSLKVAKWKIIQLDVNVLELIIINTKKD